MPGSFFGFTAPALGSVIYLRSTFPLYWSMISVLGIFITTGVSWLLAFLAERPMNYPRLLNLSQYSHKMIVVCAWALHYLRICSRDSLFYCCAALVLDDIYIWKQWSLVSSTKSCLCAKRLQFLYCHYSHDRVLRSTHHSGYSVLLLLQFTNISL